MHNNLFRSRPRLERAGRRAQRPVAGPAAHAAPPHAHPRVPLCPRLDNSRLVKAADPVRVREMRLFSGAIAVLFSLVMVYGMQHFYAIESSYRVESEKQALEPVARREPPVAPRPGRAHPARPHRYDGPPARPRRAPARTGRSSQRRLSAPDTPLPPWPQYDASASACQPAMRRPARQYELELQAES